MVITSRSNEKIKKISKCMKSAKFREEQDAFIVEGLRMFSEIPKHQLLETYVTEDFYEKHAGLFEGVKKEFVSSSVLDSITDTKTPQGVVSLVKRQHYTLEDVIKGDKPLLLALENIQDPGNLGTIIRTAEGADVTGLLISDGTVDVYNPKVVRATMGSIFRVPFLFVDNLPKTILHLDKEGFETFGAHLHGKNFYGYDYNKPTVFCIGNEGKGLTEELSNVVKNKITIPMSGHVESLNAATAATVLMYEAMRQRLLFI